MAAQGGDLLHQPVSYIAEDTLQHVLPDQQMILKDLRDSRRPITRRDGRRWITTTSRRRAAPVDLPRVDLHSHEHQCGHRCDDRGNGERNAEPDRAHWSTARRRRAQQSPSQRSPRGVEERERRASMPFGPAEERSQRAQHRDEPAEEHDLATMAHEQVQASATGGGGLDWWFITHTYVRRPRTRGCSANNVARDQRGPR